MKKSISIIGLTLLMCFCTSTISAENNDSEHFQRFRFAINGGYGQRVAHINGSGRSISFPDLPTHYHKETDRKSGFHLELGAAYFFMKNFGVGMKYNTVRHGEQVTVGFTRPPNPGTHGFPISETQHFWANFIAPTLNYRFFLTERILFAGDFAVGYFSGARIGYQSEVRVSTFAGSMSLGIDVRLSSRTILRGLGFQVSLMKGLPTEREFPFGGSWLSETINIQGVDFSVGLRF